MCLVQDNISIFLKKKQKKTWGSGRYMYFKVLQSTFFYTYLKVKKCFNAPSGKPSTVKNLGT